MDLSGWQARRRELLAHPDDCGAALKAADWLDERGDPRGEFVRARCRIAMRPRGGRQLGALHAVREVLRLWPADLNPLIGADPEEYFTPIEMRFGFVTVAHCNWPWWSVHGDRLARREPLRRVRLTTMPEAVVYELPDACMPGVTLVRGVIDLGRGCVYRLERAVSDAERSHANFDLLGYARADVAARLRAGITPALLAARWPEVEFTLPPPLLRRDARRYVLPANV